MGYRIVWQDHSTVIEKRLFLWIWRPVKRAANFEEARRYLFIAGDQWTKNDIKSMKSKPIK